MLLKDQTINWVTFECDKEKGVVISSCEVVLTKTSITVTYSEVSGPCTWKGKGQSGHYDLALTHHPEHKRGTATIHYSQNGSRLEGFWSEDNYNGSWWIELDEDLPWVE